MTIARMGWASLSNTREAKASPLDGSANLFTGITALCKARSNCAGTGRNDRHAFAKDNAAEHGFNRWTINGKAYPMPANDPRHFHLTKASVTGCACATPATIFIPFIFIGTVSN